MNPPSSEKTLEIGRGAPIPTGDFPAPSGPMPTLAHTFHLTATDGPHKGESFAFEGHEVFLAGRSEEAHLAMTQDRYISRFHFLVEINPPHCRLNDLNSRTGTFVNDKRVVSVELCDGDRIRVGKTTLVVSMPTKSGETLPYAATDAHRTLAFEEEVPAVQPVENLPDTVTVSAPISKDKSATNYSDKANTKASRSAATCPIIAGYTIERELGRGGMGVVYLALRQADGSRVALKTINPAVVTNDVQVKRFLREAEILRQLDHPNIVRFLEVGESHGVLFFAMDYIEGTDAAQMLKAQGPLGITTAVRMVCQLLKALEFAHAKGYVHRDLKPANLLIAMVDDKKMVKLADFGLARVYQKSHLSGLTLHGDLGGTFAFMPPEQLLQFRDVKPAADQYSAAATLYTLLTGQKIYYPPATDTDWYNLILKGDPVPIQARRPEITAPLAAVIHKAMAKKPEDRYADVSEFRRVLKQFA